MATTVVVPDQMQESLRDKLTGVFVSMEKNLSLQTKTLQGMYRIQKDSFIMEKNRIEDQNRAERFARNEDAPAMTGAPAVQTPEPVSRDEKPKVDGGALGAALTGALSGILGSLPSLIVPFIGRVAIGSAIAGFVEGSILAALDATEGDGTWKSQLAKALGTASLMGVIGSLFGKRAALIFAAGGFMYELGAQNEGALNEAFNAELSPSFWGMIGGGIGLALTAVLPGLIFRNVARFISRMRLPPIGATPPGTSAGAPRPTSTTGATAPRTTPRGFEARQVDGQTRYFSTRTGQQLTGAAADTAARTAAMDAAASQSIMDQAARRFPGFRNLLKVNAVIGGLISLPFIASILMDNAIDNNTKMALLAEEVGALGGSVLGATVGALGASMIPGVNLGWGQIIGGIGGGIIGSFAGGAIANQIAAQILGDNTTASEGQIAELEALAMRNAVTSRAGVSPETQLLNDRNALVPQRVEARPELSPQAAYDPYAGQYDVARMEEWDRRYGQLYNADGTLKQSLRGDYDRLTRAITSTTDFTAPAAPIPVPPLEIIPGETSEADILRIIEQANADLLSRPAQVTVVGGQTDGSVRYQDNRSTNYFISNTNQTIENSLNPFF